MSIDNAMNSRTGAPEEHNVSDNGRGTDLCFAPLEGGEIFAGARSINISPLWAKGNILGCTSKLNPPGFELGAGNPAGQLRDELDQREGSAGMVAHGRLESHLT